MGWLSDNNITVFGLLDGLVPIHHQKRINGNRYYTDLFKQLYGRSAWCPWWFNALDLHPAGFPLAVGNEHQNPNHEGCDHMGYGAPTEGIRGGGTQQIKGDARVGPFLEGRELAAKKDGDGTQDLGYSKDGAKIGRIAQVRDPFDIRRTADKHHHPAGTDR